jgi:hypothetical protein
MSLLLRESVIEELSISFDMNGRRWDKFAAILLVSALYDTPFARCLLSKKSMY